MAAKPPPPPPAALTQLNLPAAHKQAGTETNRLFIDQQRGPGSQAANIDKEQVARQGDTFRENLDEGRRATSGSLMRSCNTLITDRQRLCDREG